MSTSGCFNQIYSKIKKQNAEQKDLKNLQFG
jgi:hypothetical protein